MKKILFCLQTMVCGGVEKELITILKRFDRTEYELYVLVLYEQDKNIQSLIPEDVSVISLNIDKEFYCSGSQKLMVERLKKGKVMEALQIGKTKLCGEMPAPTVVSLDNLPMQNEQYDYAVCYHMHSPIALRYVVEKVNATRKIAWIHNDFTTTGYKVNQYGKWLDCYDLFVGVSKRLTEEFVSLCPQYQNKAITVHNIVDKQEIIEKSLDLLGVESSFIEEKRFKVVTVGRFVEQKGFDLAVLACEYLKKNNVEISWYAIGYGKDAEYIKNLVRAKGLEKDFIILGRKENPYPYISLSDLYVQPSRHEGYAITIEEAKALSKVIVCTDFAGAQEQIQNGIDGVIASEFTAEAIGDAILQIYNDKVYFQKLYNQVQNKEDLDDWKRIEDVFKL